MKKCIPILLSALAILFFIGINTKAAKAESTPQVVPGNVDEEVRYIPLPIDTIFNSKSDRKISVDQRFFLASFTGGEIITPVYDFVYKPIENDEKNDFEGNTVSLSYLKNFFEIDDSFLSNKYQIVFEYTTRTPVFLTDLKNKVLTVNNYYFKELMKNPMYSELKEIRFFSIPELVEYYVEDNTEKEYILNSGDMKSIPEYLETIYKKYVPTKYWPVDFEYQNTNNINSNLPKLKEEISNSSKEHVYILKIFKKNKHDENELYKIGLFKAYRIEGAKSWYHKDLYTDEIINVNFNDYELPYINLNDAKYSLSTVSDVVNTSNISHDINDGLVLDIINKMCWETKTIGEMVELYKQLPIEYQVDYSYFDFSKSPNVDPAWLAAQPAFVPPPAPTPPPYTELTTGSKGQEVLAMKQRFLELGYFRTDNYSDQFNANTADTVKLFEKNNGLPVDGVADSQMLALLFSDSAVGK